MNASLSFMRESGPSEVEAEARVSKIGRGTTSFALIGYLDFP